jgi:hypothetical protein
MCAFAFIFDGQTAVKEGILKGNHGFPLSLLLCFLSCRSKKGRAKEVCAAGAHLYFRWHEVPDEGVNKTRNKHFFPFSHHQIYSPLFETILLQNGGENGIILINWETGYFIYPVCALCTCKTKPSQRIKKSRF